MLRYLVRAVSCTAVLAALTPSLQARETQDPFEYLDRMNRAATLMLLEEGIVTHKQATTIANAIRTLRAEADSPSFRRSGHYVLIEPRLLEIGGPDVSRLHTGRSSIDTGRTNLRLQQRDLILAAYQDLLGAREALLAFARMHAQAIVPAYTLGVQAQPTSMGHYIAGYLSVYERHAQLLRDTYRNINQSPLGAAALGTSSYPINRLRLAELLGFEAPIRNSFDAVQLATLEASMRITGATSAIAMTTGELMSDLEDQYRMAHPWLTLPRDMAGGSSIMPQKLNPTALNQARTQASAVLGHGVSYMLGAHKASAGDTDLMFSGPNEALTETATMMRGVDTMFSALRFDEQRALQEVLNDYAVATELANALQLLADVPFRDAHHIAAAVVDFGRDKKLRLSQISFENFAQVYADASVKHRLPPLHAAFTEPEFQRVLQPQNMVMSSRGYGGPQPSEVEAMLQALTAHLEIDRGWLREQHGQLATAATLLDGAFSKL